MLEQILYPAIIIGAIGLFFGALLAFASIIFKVEKDDRIDKIAEILPGANCGGCGCAGCSAFAESIVNNGARITKCNLITEDKAEKIASIMGMEAGKIIRKKATVTCSGTCESCQNKCETYGITDCYSASQLGNGIKNCEYGCIGLGSCVKVCPTGAIEMKNGISEINSEKCIGCGKCASACPKNVIQIIPEKRTAAVKCMSKDKGIIVKKYCSAGCIGCKICEKKCPKDAIHVIDNLARVDYDKCVGCGICVKECPKQVIELIK